MLSRGSHKVGVKHSVPHQRSSWHHLRVLTVARYVHHHDDPGKHRFPLSEGLPLSLFHPFKRLPPEGTTLPLEEETCDPEEQKCKTPVHVYEARCTGCCGTGWARAPSNGRRGHLSTCIVCHGLGYVRRTTSRFWPDDPDKHMIIARPLTWNGKFAARLPQHASSSGNSSSRPGSSMVDHDGTAGIQQQQQQQHSNETGSTTR